MWHETRHLSYGYFGQGLVYIFKGRIWMDWKFITAFLNVMNYSISWVFNLFMKLVCYKLSRFLTHETSNFNLNLDCQRVPSQKMPKLRFYPTTPLILLSLHPSRYVQWTSIQTCIKVGFMFCLLVLKLCDLVRLLDETLVITSQILSNL